MGRARGHAGREFVQTYQIQDAFKKAFKGRDNLITPEILKYGCAGSYFYELSYGEDTDGQLFGVTVLNRDTYEQYEPLNQVFRSRREAEDHIIGIRKV